MEVSKILIKFLFKNQLFCIIGISLFFRLYYYQFLEPYTLTPDSITYYEFRDSSYRTPIYPFFIKIITFLFGRLDRFNNIVFFQELISIFTIILFYKIAVHYLRNKVIIILSTLFYGCSPIIISSTRYILTESLSLSFFIIYFYFIIEYLKRPSNLKAFIVGFFPIFLIMIRPSFLFIIPLFLFFLLLRIFILKKFKKLEIYIFVGFFITIIFLFLYSFYNLKKHNAFTISKVSTINYIAIISKSNLYNDNSDLEITKEINKLNIIYPEAWLVHSQMLLNKYPYHKVSRFVNNCLKYNFFIYFKKRFNEFIKNYDKTLYFNLSLKSEYQLSKNSSFFDVRFNVTFGLVAVLLLLEFFFIFFKAIKDKQFLWHKIFLNLFIICQLFTTFFAGWDFSRLIYPAYFLIIILIFIYIDLLFSFFKKISHVLQN
jgi:hypothetical protein